MDSATTETKESEEIRAEVNDAMDGLAVFFTAMQKRKITIHDLKEVFRIAIDLESDKCMVDLVMAHVALKQVAQEKATKVVEDLKVLLHPIDQIREQFFKVIWPDKTPLDHQLPKVSFIETPSKCVMIWEAKINKTPNLYTLIMNTQLHPNGNCEWEVYTNVGNTITKGKFNFLTDNVEKIKEFLESLTPILLTIPQPEITKEN